MIKFKVKYLLFLLFTIANPALAKDTCLDLDKIAIHVAESRHTKDPVDWVLALTENGVPFDYAQKFILPIYIDYGVLTPEEIGNLYFMGCMKPNYNNK